MRYEIKELGIGGILDQAVTLLKNHFGLLLGVTAVLYIPCSLIIGFVNLALTPQLPPMPTPEDYMAIQEAAASNVSITMAMTMALIYLVAPLTNAAVVHAIASEYLEKPTTVGEAIKRAFRVILPLIWTSILLFLAVMGGFILCIIPGIIFSFWFSLAIPVVVIEGVSGFEALKRSKQLMKGNVGTVFVLLLLVGMIQGVAVGSSALIPQPHIQIISRVVIEAVGVIFGAAALVVFYFSCRCKFENFDLTLLAQAVGTESPAEAGDDVPFGDSFDE